jgi:hypothetical protein
MVQDVPPALCPHGSKLGWASSAVEALSLRTRNIPTACIWICAETEVSKESGILEWLADTTSPPFAESSPSCHAGSTYDKGEEAGFLLNICLYSLFSERLGLKLGHFQVPFAFGKRIWLLILFECRWEPLAEADKLIGLEPPPLAPGIKTKVRNWLCYYSYGCKSQFFFLMLVIAHGDWLPGKIIEDGGAASTVSWTYAMIDPQWVLKGKWWSRMGETNTENSQQMKPIKSAHKMTYRMLEAWVGSKYVLNLKNHGRLHSGEDPSYFCKGGLWRVLAHPKSAMILNYLII